MTCICVTLAEKYTIVSAISVCLRHTQTKKTKMFTHAGRHEVRVKFAYSFNTTCSPKRVAIPRKEAGKEVESLLTEITSQRDSPLYSKWRSDGYFVSLLYSLEAVW